MKNISQIFILLLIAFSFTKCKTVKQILNSHPVSSEGERKLALKTNDKNLLQLKNCDFSLNISKGDFDTLAIPKLSELINNKKIGHVLKYSISDLKSEMKDEQIAISANIQITFDTLNASIEGDLIGTIMFTFRNDSIILFPAFKFIHVDDLTYMKVGPLKRKAIAFYLNQQLNATIGNINGYMISQISSIPLNLIDRDIASQELVKDSGLKVTLSKPLKISTPIVVSSCLVNENGIQILGSFDSLNNISQTLNNGEFKAFQDNFRTKRRDFFLDLPSEKTTYMVIGKRALSRIFNAALKDEEIDIKFATDNFLSGKIDKNINIDLSEIDCWKINPPCINCGPCPTCHGFWSCLTFLPRLALWGACETLCGAEVVTARGSCELFKQGLEIILSDKISIGDIHLNASSGADIKSSIKGLQFNEKLSSFNISSTATGLAPLKTTFEFTPEGPVGHLVCVLEFKRPYIFDAVLPKTTITDSIASSFEKDSTNGNLILKFGTPSTKFTINIFPTPLQALSSDLTVLIDCPVFLSLANIFKGFRDIFNAGDFENNILKTVFNGKYDYTLEKRELKLPIKPVKIKVFRDLGQILLKPIAKTTYIGFYRDVKK